MSYEEMVEYYKSMKRSELIGLAEALRTDIHEAKIKLKAIEDAIVYRAENDLE